jgi:peptidoglycan LD-endopeptidase CwlK
MASFSKTSMDRLNTCDPRLIELFTEVVKHYDCSVICGVRSKEEQDEAFRTKKSKVQWPDSKHNVKSPEQKSHAADVVPCPIDWNNKDAFYHFAGFVLGVAAQKGIKIRWGGDWDGDKNLKNQTFFDLPHFELVD